MEASTDPSPQAFVSARAKALEALALSDELSKSDDALRRVDRIERTVMISPEARQVLSSDGSKWG
ncbi:hypothetical protein DY000_02000969 [Brassica cretica]|uniref:Uncharacterized protein n=1 Tax=Brassica cretica TaxID=69181 RepID=A0ABQ7C4C7_BRACR|nr:hypothetical protein DY000_02000969 [Brassica cretica]